jgi:uncharacterized protein (TIGR00266 family)
MRHQITGTTLQSLELVLEPGETIYSQTHQMSWMSSNMKMNTNTGGGLLKGLMRGLAGGSVFVTQFAPEHKQGLVAFCPRFPGTIIARQLAAGETLVCRKESFLCAESSVQFEIFFRKQIGSGLFGGEGFILQKLTGPGLVFLDLSGELVEKTLAPGEQLLVHAGHVAVQDASVQFGINMIPGFKNILFGGNGLFVATLTGPGKVILQSMPIINLAEEIMRHASGGPSGAGDTETDAGKVLGGVIKGIFGNE